MNTCRWCQTEINPKMGDECVSCWALRERVQKHPEIAMRMIRKLFGPYEQGEAFARERSCQETSEICLRGV